MGQQIGKRFSKIKFVELDLIFMPKEAEKWKADIESLLRKVDTYIIIGRQISIGEEIRNKWIGVCEAQFDGHIDVEKSIPKNCLPETEFPGLIIIIGEQHMKEGGKYKIKSYYPDKRIQFITIAGFPDDTYRAGRAVKALIKADFINIDRNTYYESSERRTEKVLKVDNSLAQNSRFCGKEDPEELMDMKCGKRKDTDSTDRTTTTDPLEKYAKVKQTLLSFLDSLLNQDLLEIHSNFSSGSLSPFLMMNTSSSTHESQFSQKEYEFLLTIGGESFRLVVYDVKGMSDLGALNENEKLDEETHKTIGIDGINENCAMNVLAVRDLRKFIQELSADEVEVDVIPQIQDETETILSSFLETKFKLEKFHYLKPGSISEHHFILVCPAQYRDKRFEKMKTPKGYRTMLLIVHDLPEKAKNQEGEETIHVLFGDSMIDDEFYLNQRQKDEMHGLLIKYKSVSHEGKEIEHSRAEEMPKTDVPVLIQLERQVNIRYLSNLPRKAFSDFLDRYIRRIEPIWKTGEDPVEQCSLCIVVCFTLSRLLDDISAVVKITPQGCTNMLVVIQNCREGISPGPMLKHNPDDRFKDLTNILYGDGECYECDINLEARRKIQSFIDSN